MCSVAKGKKGIKNRSMQWTMLIIRADIPLRVCRGNRKAALRGLVMQVCMCTSACVCICLCGFMYDCLRAKESLLPGSSGERGVGGGGRRMLIDVRRCARRAEIGSGNPKFKLYISPKRLTLRPGTAGSWVSNIGGGTSCWAAPPSFNDKHLLFHNSYPTIFCLQVGLQILTVYIQSRSTPN